MDCQALTTILLIFTVINIWTASYVEAYQNRCSTPTSWLNNGVGAQFPHSDNFIVSGRLIRVPPTKWPGGVVKYKLNSTLSDQDRAQVMLAIDEYHRKTCVQFQPWTERDRRFVSIERDDNVCGFANVCMNDSSSGYQFARFGGSCRNKAMMVHELGHTICLRHEHQRHDRDNFLSFDNCPAINISQTFLSNGHNGIYDFESQMHYFCGSCDGGSPKPPYNDVAQCGNQINTGLSILDADTINAFYDCQECYRHRWIPIEMFSDVDKKNLPNFSEDDSAGRPLYPCRAAVRREVLIGMFDKAARVCYVPIEDTSLQLKMVSSYFEVLTISGGLGTKTNQNSSPSATTEYHLAHYSDLTPRNFSKGVIYAGKLFQNNTITPSGLVGRVHVNVEKLKCKYVYAICEAKLNIMENGESVFFNEMTLSEKYQFYDEITSSGKDLFNYEMFSDITRFLIYRNRKEQLLRQKCYSKYQSTLQREWGHYTDKNDYILYTVPANHPCPKDPCMSSTKTEPSSKDIRICTSKVLVCQ